MPTQLYYVRTCQECGHKQAMKPPADQKSDAWRDAMCRKCKSPALNYGSDGWTKADDGTFVKPANHDD